MFLSGSYTERAAAASEGAPGISAKATDALLTTAKAAATGRRDHLAQQVRTVG